jgi:DNA modification methylase
MLGDVLDYAADTNLGHAAQKPVALLQDLLSRSALPGNVIFDPFAGSGSVMAAAHPLKCITCSIELDPASYGIIIERVSKLKEAQELDAGVGR